MRAYSASSEEALLARNLLKEWTGEGFLTEAQHQSLETETVCELRRANIFLRLVLFLFTAIVVGAAAGLFFAVFLSGLRSQQQSISIFLLIFAAISYVAAEVAVSQAHLYRYGIEEALAVCSVLFLCGGLVAAELHGTQFLVPAAGAITSLWIWHRFGLAYAFLAAMICVVPLPDYWTSSHAARHLMVAALYAAGLAGVAAARSRHRFDYLDEGYSIVEALLWLGIYVAINLQLSQLWGGTGIMPEFPRTFYWGSWALTWCLPAAILARGLRRKDRFVIAVGGIAAILTLVTNKLYLGWERHTWDPMLLGLVLAGVALFIHRWLRGGPSGIRYGFTAQRLSGKDKRWMNAGSIGLGLVVPQSPPASTPAPHFGGGDSGGGGASSDF